MGAQDRIREEEKKRKRDISRDKLASSRIPYAYLMPKELPILGGQRSDLRPKPLPSSLHRAASSPGHLETGASGQSELSVWLAGWMRYGDWQKKGLMENLPNPFGIGSSCRRAPNQRSGGRSKFAGFVLALFSLLLVGQTWPD